MIRRKPRKKILYRGDAYEKIEQLMNDPKFNELLQKYERKGLFEHLNEVYDEICGDVALYRKDVREALRQYDLALEFLPTTIARYEGEAKHYSNPEDGPNAPELKAAKLALERITKKRDRTMSSLSGKRKYLSGQGHPHRHNSGLESKIAGIVGIISIVSAFVLLSQKITGNVIGNFIQINYNYSGLALLAFGLICLFAYMKLK